MKRMTLTVVLCLVMVLSLSGCTFGTTFDSSTRITGSGKMITEIREVSGFNGVDLAAVGKLYITQGAKEGLTITGDDNIVPLIKTEVRAGVLVIEFTTPNISLNDLRGITYNLTVVNLTSLVVSGAGDISVDDLKAENLSVLVSGAGNIEVAGKVSTQEIKVSGAGNYNAADLMSGSVKVTISGAGNATVWAQTTLDVTISGLGRVSYYGEPVVTKSISGAGSIEAKGDK